MTEDFCSNTLSIADILLMKISIDGTEENSVPITKGIVKKYNYYDLYDQDISLDDAALKALEGTPTFSSSDASCDNFALEYHLRI